MVEPCHRGMRNMSEAVKNLLSILDLEQLEQNLYRGQSPNVGWQRVFGGQVIGQALVAAQRTIEEHRKVLLEMLPQMTWREGPPDGYTVDAEGNVRSNNFESYY